MQREDADAGIWKVRACVKSCGVSHQNWLRMTAQGAGARGTFPSLAPPPSLTRGPHWLNPTGSHGPGLLVAGPVQGRILERSKGGGEVSGLLAPKGYAFVGLIKTATLSPLWL